MSPDYRDRYRMMQDGDPTQQNNHGAIQERYATQSQVRNIVFELADGQQYCLNYNYLVCIEQPDHENLLLHFTTHRVQLTGRKLDTVFTDLVKQVPRVISCSDERYDLLAEEQPVVHDIIITTTG